MRLDRIRGMPQCWRLSTDQGCDGRHRETYTAKPTRGLHPSWQALGGIAKWHSSCEADSGRKVNRRPVRVPGPKPDARLACPEVVSLGWAIDRLSDD